MSIILCTLVWWIPSLLIFPLTRLMRAYISSGDAQPQCGSSVINAPGLYSNNTEIFELNNYINQRTGIIVSLYKTEPV